MADFLQFFSKKYLHVKANIELTRLHKHKFIGRTHRVIFQKTSTVLQKK